MPYADQQEVALGLDAPFLPFFNGSISQSSVIISSLVGRKMETPLLLTQFFRAVFDLFQNPHGNAQDHGPFWGSHCQADINL